MNIRDLKYLVAVAEHKHFGKAAEACFVSQPTLSTQVKKLEEYLGVTLIERTNRQVLLTPVGEAVVRQAKRVLGDLSELVQLAEQFQDPLGGELRLGIIPTVAPYLLPKILPRIRKAFPSLKLQLIEAQTSVITEMLKLGELDALILALPVEEEHLTEALLYREPFYLAVGQRHPKAGAKSATLADLNEEQVLLLEDGHCLRDQALEICNSANAVENTNFRATSLETLRQMVSADIGVTLMPELALGNVRSSNDSSAKSTRQSSDGVSYIPFRKPVPHREIGLVWRQSSTRSELLEKMVALLRRK